MSVSLVMVYSFYAESSEQVTSSYIIYGHSYQASSVQPSEMVVCSHYCCCHRMASLPALKRRQTPDMPMHMAF